MNTFCSPFKKIGCKVSYNLSDNLRVRGKKVCKAAKNEKESLLVSSFSRIKDARASAPVANGMPGYRPVLRVAARGRRAWPGQNLCMFPAKPLHVLEKTSACFHKKPCMFPSSGFDRVMYHSEPVASIAMGKNGTHSHKMPVKRGIFCRFLREDKVKILNYSLYISLFRHFFRIFATIFKERQS